MPGLRHRSGGLVRVLAAVVTFAVVLAFGPPAAAAPSPPASLCASQTAALHAVRQRVTAHNAKPHVFQVPRQSGALAAYNADAAKLKAEQAAAIANLKTCIAVMGELADSANTSLELEPLPSDLRAKIIAAKARIPASWTPPPPPSVGKNWTVKGTPVEPLWEALRYRNPPPGVGNATLRGDPRPVVGAPDPAYPRSKVFGTNADGDSKASPDHIVPLAQIVNMPGFTRLSPDSMYVVTRSPVNFQWLSDSANKSKQSRSVAGMAKADPKWKDEQVALADEVSEQLQAIIDRLLKIQG
ncbi:hypothetical protein [Micromonospora zamorensis]|uniref:hypothetical protein n=1 Tax=Micromonospora zamorensis TaxID=709883 RepID=UPI002ED41638|nr:hypothetical protein OG886_04095 [Micromonospora zamorensis]